MVQHLLVMLIAAPLLIGAHPGEPFIAAIGTFADEPGRRGGSASPRDVFRLVTATGRQRIASLESMADSNVVTSQSSNVTGYFEDPNHEAVTE